MGPESPEQPFRVGQAYSAYGSVLSGSLQTAGVSKSSTVDVVTRDFYYCFLIMLF